MSRNGTDRTFAIPAHYDISVLARALSGWLESENQMETEIIESTDGLLVQAKVVRGHFTRILSGKAKTLHILIVPDKNRLRVKLGTGEWIKPEDRNSGGFFGLTKVAAFAFNTAADAYSAAASGITDIFTDKTIVERIFDFIGGHITGYFEKKSVQREIDYRDSRYVEFPGTLEKVWIASFMGPHELLLAWLHTGTQAPDASADWIFSITSHRHFLVRFSKTGFEKLKILPDTPMDVTDVIGRDTVSFGETAFKTQMQNDFLFREVAPLIPLSTEHRIAETARLNFIHGKKNDIHLRYAQSLLDYLWQNRPFPLYKLSALYIESYRRKTKEEPELFEKIMNREDVVKTIGDMPGAVTSEELRQWAESWEVDNLERIVLAEHIQEHRSESIPHAELVSPMLETAYQRIQKESKDETLLMLADIRFSENLIQLGRDTEAVSILENRLSKLPDETLADLLPPRDSDLTKGEAGQLIRVKILSLLAEAKKDANQSILKELAVLQPLDPRRLRPLADSDNAALRRRVETPLRLIAPGGLSLTETGDDYGATPIESALPPEKIEGRLRHPAAREGSVVNSFQNLIATKKVPDHSALKAYAKRITLEKHPEIASAISEGCFMLGMNAVDAFISYGEMGFGVRSYDGSPPFILIGGDHLEGDDALALTPMELRFIIGVELAHLRFKHERITSREVWEGVFDKTVTIMEFVPIVGTYIGKIGKLGEIAIQAGDLAKKIGNVKQYLDHVQKIASSARKIYTKKDTEKEEKSEEKELLSAFRVMQLSADRAGLLLSGDLKSSVRAMFITHKKLFRELSHAEELGLDRFLSRTDEKGEMMFQEPAIRIAALFSFYLSDDYIQLREIALTEMR